MAKKGLIAAAWAAALAYLNVKSGADAGQVAVNNPADDTRTGLHTVGNDTESATPIELEPGYVEQQVKEYERKNAESKKRNAAAKGIRAQRKPETITLTEKEVQSISRDLQEKISRDLQEKIRACNDALITIDRSGTQESMFNAARAGVVEVIKEMFKVSPMDNLPTVGIFSYSSYGVMNVAPTTDAATVQSGAAGVPYSGGGTLLQTALQLILTQIRNNPALVTGAILYIPIFSDFQDDDPATLMALVNQIHAEAAAKGGRTQFVPIGVDGGYGVNTALMHQISGNKPEYEQIFPAAELVKDASVKKVVDIICPLVATKRPSAAPTGIKGTLTPSFAPTANVTKGNDDDAAAASVIGFLFCFRKRRKPKVEPTETEAEEIDVEIPAPPAPAAAASTTTEEVFEDEKPNVYRESFKPEHKGAGEKAYAGWLPGTTLLTGSRTGIVGRERTWAGEKGAFEPPKQETPPPPPPPPPAKEVVKVPPAKDDDGEGTHYEAVGFLSFAVAIQDSLAKQGVIDKDTKIAKNLRWVMTKFELNVTPITNAVAWVGKHTGVTYVLDKTGVLWAADKVDQGLGKAWDFSVKYAIALPITVTAGLLTKVRGAFRSSKKETRTIGDVDAASQGAQGTAATGTDDRGQASPNPVLKAELDRIYAARAADAAGARTLADASETPASDADRIAAARADANAAKAQQMQGQAQGQVSDLLPKTPSARPSKGPAVPPPRPTTGQGTTVPVRPTTTGPTPPGPPVVPPRPPARPTRDGGHKGGGSSST